jgi:hypothetical protein
MHNLNSSFNSPMQQSNNYPNNKENSSEYGPCYTHFGVNTMKCQAPCSFRKTDCLDIPTQCDLILHFVKTRFTMPQFIQRPIVRPSVFKKPALPRRTRISKIKKTSPLSCKRNENLEGRSSSGDPYLDMQFDQIVFNIQKAFGVQTV